MSVTQYEIPCAYDLLKLKDTVFFLSKNSLKTITIDNGEAYADFVNQSPYPPSPNRLKGFNVKLTETESLDERYKFTKQLTMSIHGHLTDSRFLMDDDYYIVVQTEEGTYYLVNVDFPSKMTYTYNLSNGQNQTDFTFTSNSNHPTLKLNWNPVTWNTCQTYQVFGIDGLKLLEKDYTTIDAEQSVINLFDGYEFKEVDYLKNTISLQEAYDGEITTTTITFEIPFNNYKPSWQYNLLEFDQNLYAAHITPKSSDSGIFAGYEHGLQPSYELNGSTSDGESTTIKITLVEASNWGIFEFDTWSYYRDSTKTWVGIDSEVKCIDLGVGINTLMQEVDGNGTPTGRYKCLEGYENRYSNYNIVETYEEAPRFTSSDCARSMARRVNTDEIFTCINGDKYSIKFTQMSYDNKKTWVRVSDYELGEMVESGSTWCEIEPQYKWEISDEWECIAQFTRWVESGTTCILGNKYKNNYKQLSDDGINWYNSNPLEWSASTMVESASTDCISYRWVDSTNITCVEVIDDSRYKVTSGTPYCDGYDKYMDVTSEISYDSGTTWEIARVDKVMVESCSDDCSMIHKPLTFVALENTTFRFNDTPMTGESNTLSYSLDSGDTWVALSANTNTPTVQSGHTIMWKGTATPKANQDCTCDYGDTYCNCFEVKIGVFSSTGRFNAEGNIMSLIYGDEIDCSTDTITNGCMFRCLFKDCNTLVSCENLLLPATNLKQHCYEGMFENCTSLTTPPRALPATTLANYCYNSMFKGCTSLTESPILSARTMVLMCYDSMFSGCTSLSSITSLSDEIGDNGTGTGSYHWVEGVAPNGVFTKRFDAWYKYGSEGVPNGWTINDLII